MDDECLSFLSRHMVMLSWTDEPKDGDLEFKLSKRRAMAVPVNVISWRGQWYLLTAGHILDDIEKMVASDRKIISSQLWDGHVYGATDRSQIYFDIENAVKYSATHTVGQDFGLIVLGDHYRRALEANGVKAYVETTWTNIPDDMSFHLMLGLPSCYQAMHKRKTGEITHLETSVTVIPVRQVDSIPPCLICEKPRFYGRLDQQIRSRDGAELTDIDGMSGGPIMGFKKLDDGSLRYWLVAIQSGWESNSRVISAAPMRMLEQMFLEAEVVMLKDRM